MFLALNGVEIEVRDGGATRAAPIEIGEQSRAFDGTLRKSRQTIKRAYGFETVPLTEGDAEALDSLILGLGHVWSFDTDLYSSKGLTYSAATASSFQASGSSKFGAGRLKVNATTGTITFSYSTGTEWTAMVWRSTNGTTWNHHIIRSDGTKWLDGVVSVASVSGWFTGNGSAFTLANASGSDNYFDDLVILPYEIPASWAEVFGVSASAFSSLPKLTATGDGIHRASATVIGSVGDQKYVQGVVSGSYISNARQVAFVLEEA